MCGVSWLGIREVKLVEPAPNPVATSADQCKKDGWQSLVDDLGNGFKNQGDCVSFVATKGKNTGAGGQQY